VHFGNPYPAYTLSGAHKIVGDATRGGPVRSPSFEKRNAGYLLARSRACDALDEPTRVELYFRIRMSFEGLFTDQVEIAGKEAVIARLSEVEVCKLAAELADTAVRSLPE